MNSAVGGAIEVVDIGLVHGRPGQTHERTCAEGDGGEVGEGELQVSFHRTRYVSLYVQRARIV